MILNELNGHDIPDAAEQKASINKCKQHLKMIANMMPTKNGIMSPSALLLKYGKGSFMNESSFVGKRHQAKACFMNAYRLATNNSNLTYVEGQVDIGPLTIEHAWVIDSNNIVIDPTLESPNDSKTTIYPRGYFGIAFDTNYIMKVALRSKVYGILSYTNKEIFMGKDTPDNFLSK